MSVLPDDRDLLERFRAGRTSAVEAVYREYFDDVARLVRFGFTLGANARVHGVTNPSDQADLIQDIFVRVFSKKARHGYDGVRPYRPYLLRIARNLMIDRVRKQGREVSVDADDGPDIDVLLRQNADAPDLEDQLHQRNKEAATRRYIDSLPTEYQRFVTLRFVEGRAQAEVASAMGVTRRRVRTLEKTALNGLVRFLKDEGLFEGRPKSILSPYKAIRGDS